MIIHETLRKNTFSEKSVSDERSRISRHGWVNQYSGCPDLLAKGDQWDAIARGLDPQIYNGRAQVLKFWYSIAAGRARWGKVFKHIQTIDCSRLKMLKRDKLTSHTIDRKLHVYRSDIGLIMMSFQ